MSTAIDFAALMKAEKLLDPSTDMHDPYCQDDEGPQNELSALGDSFTPIPELGPTVCLLQDFITPDDEARLVASIYKQAEGTSPWHQLPKRRLQMFGGIPDTRGTVREPLPRFLADLSRRLGQRGVFNARTTGGFDQVLLNEYVPPQGISPHQDGPLFKPRVAILSLLSGATMVFSRDAAATEEVGRVLLPARSLLLFEDAAYTTLYHSIATQATDDVDGQEVPRSTRLSVTMRCVAVSREPMHTEHERAELARREERWVRSISEREPPTPAGE